MEPNGHGSTVSNENLREMCLFHALDPAHDITLRNFAWWAMTRVRLQQRHNGDMYEIIENELRGR